MSETPMSEERISDLEMRRSVGRITSDDGSELLREVRRQSEPQARPGVDALLRPFEDMLRLLARSDSTSPEADAEFEHAIAAELERVDAEVRKEHHCHDCPECQQSYYEMVGALLHIGEQAGSDMKPNVTTGAVLAVDRLAAENAELKSSADQLSDLNANQQRQIHRLTADRDALAGRMVAACKSEMEEYASPSWNDACEACIAAIRAIIDAAKGE